MELAYLAVMPAQAPAPVDAVAADVAARILANVEQVVVGKHDEIALVLAALISGGHVLLEDVPGTAKTILARAIAQSVGGTTFARIQCTPDLQPTDITGLSIFDQRTREFEFRPGPVFANVVLVDETNRAMPRTQSALLEAMAELQVTVSGTTYKLKPPYFVMATLNPIEMEGTYPLPEAQLDRFLFKVRLNYPDETELTRIISSTTGPEDAGIEPIFHAIEAPDRIEALKRLVREVMAAPAMEIYAARLVRATQPQNSRFVTDEAKSVHDEMVNRYVMFGSSPRGAQALILGAKVRALLDGRANIAREDIEHVAVPALAHRIMLNYAALSDGIDAAHIVERVIKSVRAAKV